MKEENLTTNQRMNVFVSDQIQVMEEIINGGHAKDQDHATYLRGVICGLKLLQRKMLTMKIEADYKPN